MTHTRVLVLPLALLLVLALAAPALGAAPTDPMAGAQQPLQIMRVGEALDRVAAPLADVLVFVPDTGLDLDHPDLQPRLFSLPADTPAPAPDGGNPGTVQAGRPGWDLIGTLDPGPLAPDDDPTDPPGHGHGTAVSGVLGAAWDNGQGGAGVAPNARFIALRTCWKNDQCYNHVQASAFDWAADRGARVVSMSWLSGDLMFGLGDAITNNSNTLFVAIPSGGGGPADADPNNPVPCTLDVPNVLCVSTSSPSDGLSCGWYGATAVDVAVPTENSITTFNDGSFGATNCATSYAAPTAAGVATILFGIDPTAGPADVKAAIMDSARRVPDWEGKSVTGGVVDALAAVDLFQSRRGIAPREPAQPPAPAPVPAPAPPGSQPPPADVTPPVLAFDVTPGVFRAGGGGARLASPLGGRLVATVSEAATLRVVVERARPGRRRGARCVAPTRAPRGRRCTRWVRAGAIERALAAGTTRIRFAARDRRGRRLPVGSYRARATAADAAGNVSPARVDRFRIAAR